MKLALISSFVIAASAQNLQSCVTDFNSETDYFTQKYNETNSEFTVTYSKHYKTLINKLSNQTFVLHQCGTPVPKNVPAGAAIYSIPLKKIAVGDTTVLTFLEALGVSSAITLSSALDYTVSPCLQASNITALNATNLRVQAEQYKTVDAYFTGYASDSNPNNTVLFPASNSKDSDYRTNWIDMIGEDTAKKVRSSIEDNFSCLLSGAKDAGTKEGKPVIAWTNYEAPSDFNQNKAAWVVSAAPYKLDYSQDAGGNPLNLGEVRKSFATSKEFLEAIANVDIIIDESFASLNATNFHKTYSLESNTTTIKAFDSKNIYQEQGLVNAIGGSAWFESAVLFKHLVLGYAQFQLVFIPSNNFNFRDLISILHPQSMPGYKRTYFINIFSEKSKVVNESDCKAEDKNQLSIPKIQCPVKIESPKSSSRKGFVASGALALFLVTLLL
ncbi:hypothetical protein HK099_004679 [Clydaea vesicula]|uniref:Periplasmic binding protein n=1 Tax=Clydaea vesicula TaxID=447962 RepID=A0AAD5XVG2_9FUNG|nr:hypothetical protein HK099_004679 [Clydaea vesicula]